ncbi:hypothetical protein U1Q18_050927, partial [Sarracenia purpurea var. burkii]
NKRILEIKNGGELPPDAFQSFAQIYPFIDVDFTKKQCIMFANSFESLEKGLQNLPQFLHAEDEQFSQDDNSSDTESECESEAESTLSP